MRFLFIGLLALAGCLPVSVFAAMTQTLEKSGTRYFLFSVPNKIERFDIAAGTFADPIVLNAGASVLAVDDSYAYVAHGREVRRYSLADGNSTFVRNGGTDIAGLVVLGDWLITFEGRVITVLDRSNFAVVDTHSGFYTGTSYVAAESLNAVLYRTTGVSPSDIRKLSLDGAGQVLSDRDSTYHGDFPNASFIRLFPDESRVADSTGVVYAADTLTYVGSLVGAFVDLAVSGDTLVVARNDSLDQFDGSLKLLSSYDPGASPGAVSLDGDTVYYFTVTDSTVTANSVALADFEEPGPVPAADPLSVPLNAERIDIDPATGEVFLLDHDNKTVFIWSAVTEDWLPGYGLESDPTWMTFSQAHGRLYLGYSDGRITYFDTVTDDGQENYLLALPQAVLGLKAAGDYLFSADVSGAWERHYSINADGDIVDSQDWRNTGQEYLWSPLTERIYHFRDGSSPNDIEYAELSQVDGSLGLDGDSPYHSSTGMTYPLRMSDDGSYILTGAGWIFDVTTLNQVNALSNTITDAAWVSGSLFTLAGSGGNDLQYWSPVFEKTLEFTLPGSGDTRILGHGGKLIVLYQLASGARLEAFDPFDLPDTDGDGVIDPADNCPDLANAGQTDTDNDGVGDDCDPDSDNDLIPDEVEIAAGTNPYSYADALDDRDGDGASNLLEYLEGTGINDAASTPAPSESFLQSFEQAGWEGGNWVVVESAAGLWQRSSATASHGDYSLVVEDSRYGVASEMHYRALFPAGRVSLKLHRPSGFSNYGRLQVFLDDVQQCSMSYASNWYDCSFDVTEGEHAVVIRYSVTASYAGNSPMYMDEFTFAVDNSDADYDGILDDVDNCPDVANAGQDNLDGDAFGDACDNDIDGDGISNTIENAYLALDPYDASDREEDYDGDGVTDADEVALGRSPDSADDYPVFDLMDYLYPREHTRFEQLSTGTPAYSTATVTWSREGNGWQVGPRTFKTYLEQREAGLVTVSSSSDPGTEYHRESTYQPPLVRLPARMQLGARFYTATDVVEEGYGAAIETLNISDELVLTGTGTAQFQGRTINTVRIERKRVLSRTGSDTQTTVTVMVYGEGIGMLASQSDTGFRMQLSDIVEHGSGSQDDGRPPVLLVGSGGDSGGLAAFGLLLALISMRRRH